MSEQAQKPKERERREWLLILLLLLLGFLCVCLAGQWAVRFDPFWRLNAGMDSNIDPNVGLTNAASDQIEPLDPNILTPPSWLDLFLTPGALGTLLPTTTLQAVTNTPAVTVTGTLVTASPTVIPSNTPIIIYVPPSNTPKPPPGKKPLDLAVTKDDGVTTYTAGATLNYTIVVTNNGPNDVIGASINDAIPTQIISWTWSCGPVVNASLCDGSGGSTSSDFSDTFDIQNGGSITYNVSATVDNPVSGDLDNTASVSVPTGYINTNASNGDATDTDTFILYPYSYGNIGPGYDGSIENILAGTFVYLTLSSPITVDGSHAGWDLIFYEYANSVGIRLDRVILSVSSDGSTWFEIFNWGDGIADTDSSVPIPLGAPNPTDCSGEPDDCEIDSSFLDPTYGTGVLIDLDLASTIPFGTTVNYISIEVLSGGDGNDGIDGIYVIP